MPDLKSAVRVGGRSRTAVPEERAAAFITSVARDGGALPAAAPEAVAMVPAVVEQPTEAAAPPEKTREIHVRIPMSLHKQLAHAAVDRNLSLTQLAATALALGLERLEPVDE